MQKELDFLKGEAQQAYSSGGETPRGQKGTPGGTDVPGITGSIPHSFGTLGAGILGAGVEENGTGAAVANDGTIGCAPGKLELAYGDEMLFVVIGMYIMVDGWEVE